MNALYDFPSEKEYQKYLRTYFAAMEKSFPIESFFRSMLIQFDKESGSTRRTDGHPTNVMGCNEIIRAIAAWKVQMADALIEELNKESAQ